MIPAKMVDPTASSLSAAWYMVAGYRLTDEQCQTWHDAMYIFPFVNGEIKTGAGHDGRQIVIRWEAINGFLHVTVDKTPGRVKNHISWLKDHV